MGRVERPVHRFQEPGDPPGAHPQGIKQKDRFGKLDGAEEGEEVAGVVAVGLGGVFFQVDGASSNMRR